MTLVEDWRERHPRKSSKGRVVFYIFLLIKVLIFILKADSMVAGFTRIFFPSDSTTQEPES